MHYYQWNIGDYASHTSRLSQSEDLAYRRLLDLYYLTEQTFNECSTDVAREIGMIDQLEAVEYILNKFFVLLDGEWTQDRCEREISKYHKQLESASKAGKASAKARRNKKLERPLNDRLETVEPTNNHKPITNNHKPKKKNIPYQTILDSYHENAPDLPKVQILTDKRKRAIKKFWDADEKHQNIEFYDRYFIYVNQSPLLTGKVEPTGDRSKPWKANLEWIMDINHFANIIERKYHD